MPADNDNVELGPQIATPSSPAPSLGQPTTPIYRPVITHNFSATNSYEVLWWHCWQLGLFEQQWSDYEMATGLDKRQESVPRATLRLSMVRECLSMILLNLNLWEEDNKKIESC